MKVYLTRKIPGPALEMLREKFNVIFFTPPYFEGVPGSLLEQALMDPAKALARRFFTEAGDYLRDGGYVQMLYSSLAGAETVLGSGSDRGWRQVRGA